MPAEHHAARHQVRASDRRSSRLGRRLALFAGLAVLIVGALFVAQTWRVIDAIGQAQQAVVPLPTEQPAVAAPTAAALPAPPLAAGGTNAAVPAAAQRAPADDESVDQPSALAVASQMLGASFDRGDPGRADAWNGRTELNILVLGIDRRPDGGDQNADVIILARLDLIEKRLTAVSLPRDLLVELPGIGPDRINSAYNYGVQADPDDPAAGVAFVRDTIQHNFSVPIDGYVLVDFAGFESVVDAVGGIEIDVPAPILDPAYPSDDFGTEELRFEAGPQHMDGERALKYARTRNADSDDQRRDRQLQVLLALFEQGKNLGSVARADDLIIALGDAVQTGFNLEQQLLLARIGLQTEFSDIEMTTVDEPLIAPGTTETGAWVYVGDPVAIADFIHQALLGTGVASTP